MTSDEILALTPGPQLDAAIHLHVFSNPGKAPAYSTKDAAGMKILDRLPLFVGKLDPAHPKYDSSRPFVAGTLAHEPSLNGDVTRLRVTAPSRLVALCKAALLVVLRPAKAERPAPRQSSAEQARDIAARIGTPAARNPNNPRVSQPTVHRGRDARPPMPQRPANFVGPKPVAVPGRNA